MSQSLLAFSAYAAARAHEVQDTQAVDLAYQAFFATEHGRLVLVDLFNRHNMMAPSLRQVWPSMTRFFSTA
jgi:hypothetical protein